MATTVRAEFTILGNFDPDSLIEKAGLRPTRTWRKGELKNGTLLAFETDGISIATPDREGVGIDLVLSELLMEIEPLVGLGLKVFGIQVTTSASGDVTISISGPGGGGFGIGTAKGNSFTSATGN